LSVAEQYEWLESAAHSNALYAHVTRYAPEFDAVIALPYAMPLVQYASWAAPESVLLWPCLHDEPYAYFEPVRILMESVWAVLFNSPEEGHLATTTLRMRLSRAAVLGVGVALDLSAADGLETTERYLAYVGRLEEGKNVRLLYDYARRYFAERHNIRLLVCGKGPLEPPRQPAFVFRGVVDERQKAAVYANAIALCQPSLNESFSLTMMESWLAGRPVLVSEGCAVTRGHVRRSKGGLWFSSYEEFAGALDWLAANRELADRMGDNGRAYVRDNFTWPTLSRRLGQLLTKWQAT
jgi:glycosyltransferase involved in cell wall biosynthesis